MEELSMEMKKLSTQLVNIAEALTKLAQQVEEMATGSAASVEAAPEKKAPARRKRVVRKKKAVAAPVKEKKAVVKADAAAKAPTVLDQVYEVISKSRKGASIDKLKEKTGLEPRQLSNALYKLTKKGAVEARTRGVYFKK
jgi:predicted Rossmann fold nucleotide-binding protein DprA/Smf involved in DNA uptake